MREVSEGKKSQWPEPGRGYTPNQIFQVVTYASLAGCYAAYSATQWWELPTPVHDLALGFAMAMFLTMMVSAAAAGVTMFQEVSNRD